MLITGITVIEEHDYSDSEITVIMQFNHRNQIRNRVR